LFLQTPKISVHTRSLVDQYLEQLPPAVTGQRLGDSLFFAAPGWWRSCLAGYFNAVAELNLTPNNVLDLGCGDGLVCAFLGFIYPDAHIVALDRCKLCLASTRTIASRLGLNNLRVVHGDASDLPSLFPGTTFDLVLARAFVSFRVRCSCGRALGDPVDGVHGLARLDRILEAVHEVLNSTAGLFVSTEICSGACDLSKWAAQVAAARFEIDWTRSQGVRTARQRWTMLVSRPASTHSKVSLQDCLAFLVDAEMRENGTPAPLTGYVAEALINAVVTDHLIFGIEATRHGMLLRRELYWAGAVLMSHDATNGKEREVRFWPLSAAPHLRCQLEEEADKLTAKGWTVLRLGADT
jgi:SAM-dependent methyltransferase